MNIADFIRKNASANGIANQNNFNGANSPIMDGVNIGELQKQFNAFKKQFGNKNPQIGTQEGRLCHKSNSKN